MKKIVFGLVAVVVDVAQSCYFFWVTSRRKTGPPEQDFSPCRYSVLSSSTNFARMSPRMPLQSFNVPSRLSETAFRQ